MRMACRRQCSRGGAHALEAASTAAADFGVVKDRIHLPPVDLDQPGDRRVFELEHGFVVVA